MKRWQDSVTQQNAALVEESVATALEEQASRLTQAVSVFRITQDAVQHKTELKTPKLKSTGLTPRKTVQVNTTDENWETF